MQEQDGQRLEVGLLRPLAWLNGREVGERLELNLAEMGAEGEFQVVTVGACPEIEDGPGRIVTGIFRHSVGFAYNLCLEGRDEPIGVTERHPFWNVDREAWVAASELLVGERLLERDGIARVASLTERDPEPVYNLEVDGDHCYRVSEHGVLVHNASISECQFLKDDITYNKDSIKYLDTEKIPAGERANRVQARLGGWNVGKGEEAEFNPTGYDASLNPPEGGTAKVARGHLLANILGGAGSKTNSDSKKNLVPICHISTNLAMANQVEVPIKKLLVMPGANNIADYEVWVDYWSTTSPIPKKITIKARVFNCSTGVCTAYDKTFSNPKDLSTCPGPKGSK